jgi:hypothetical protein
MMETEMLLRKNHYRWLVAFAVAAVFLFDPASALAQKKPNGFNKSGRGNGRPAASNPQRPQSSPPRNQNRGNGNRGNGNRGNQNRGNHHGHHQNYRNQGFNHHSFPSSRFQGTGHRYSLSHFHGHYVPIVPYGVAGYPYGYGASIYRDPYIYGYNSGFNNYNSGFNNYNPAYSTYGSYLNNSGVIGSNAIGSSVAAQAFQQLQNQQPIAPNQNANSARDVEILRLQIELEKAKQQLANQNRPQQQVTMKPPVQDPVDEAKRKEAIDQLGLAPIIETNQLAATSHLKAERAFRAGDYGQAARFAGLAKSLDDSNGKLMLFAAQAHFANGEYRESLDALSNANKILPSEDLAWVVDNFKLFYGQNDFVSQMKSLSAHLKQSPNDAAAWLLRGYQYGALGYPDAAKKDLDRARELGGDSALLDSLTARFAVETPVE